jgi:predicted transcriptional regulator
MHVLDALGNPVRRAILQELRAGPRPVGEIAAGLPISRPAVSRHVRVLEDAHERPRHAGPQIVGKAADQARPRR